MKIPFLFFVLFAIYFPITAKAQTTILNIDLKHTRANVSPKLYGLMTEEINHSYDGGLYAELIRNRIFKDNPKVAESWKVLQEGRGHAAINLDEGEPINNSLTVCLKLEVTGDSGRAGVINEGFWGIPVKPQTTYKASFYAKCSNDASRLLTISIESNDGGNIYASAQVTLIKGGWRKYSAVLKTSPDIKPTAMAHFVIEPRGKGTYWFNLVSLFPPTYNNRPNGNRIDLMKLMAAMRPRFLRLPGGNFLEGDYFSTRFPWKNTLGPLEERAGHPGCWNYRASDGMGLLEFLEWCEDLKIEPVLAVEAGYTLRGDYIPAGPLLKPFVEEALQEIEYVSGSVETRWGAQRAKDGHPLPFKLNYVEIGNEDGFDKSGSYAGRLTQFYDAIKHQYPGLEIISTVGGRDALGMRFKIDPHKADAIDEHYYRTAWEMEEDASHYDDYDRRGPKIFVGEWATREGSPTPDMNAALGDAAWMTGMERNSDVVIMSCYAPLFVNVNPGAMQWSSDLIGYNALDSYGSPSYYAQKMFSNNIGDKVLGITVENLPMQSRQLTKKDSAAGVKQKAIPALFYDATLDGKTGALYIKIVNTSARPATVSLNLASAKKVAPNARFTELKGNSPEDTNTINEPEKIVPRLSNVNDMSEKYTRLFAPYSVNVLEVHLK
jgi:alpha-N-arabinofuranosidase